MTHYINGQHRQNRASNGRFRQTTIADFGMVACRACGQLFAYEARPLVCDNGIWHRVTNPEPCKCPACGTVAEAQS